MSIEYPSDLIPKETDTIFHDLPDSEWLCRRIPGELPLTEADGRISGKAIEYKDQRHLPTYSVNKIPPANVDFIKFEILNKDYHELWKPGTNGKCPADQEYTYNDSNKFICFPISKIKIETEFVPADPTDKHAKKFIFKVKAIHAPTISNFSHCQLDVSFFDSNGNVLDKRPGKDSRGMEFVYTVIRNNLVRIGNLSPPAIT
ncbi:hypothetical protein LEP1GSC041_1454 [Leptospira noguchii str. 2006001870]|uniref:hypothetical protein n=1 Tax=Leptospira noguchii TaxID=28182 RepID=UPI000248B1B6|nr:hypothetical protein [Leptospira noguchii]EKR73087.1 hypothetical protein LEP1GSC041_1454 [Leptospira noguchii str. 2006001870]